MIPQKSFVFFDHATEDLQTSLPASFPYKGDLYLKVIGHGTNGYNTMGNRTFYIPPISVSGINYIGGNKVGASLQMVELNSSAFSTSSFTNHPGLFMVIGAEGFDEIEINVGVYTMEPGTSFSVVGRFVFEG